MMDIPVLIEPVSGNGFRAKGGEPFALTAEGSTPAEALQRLRELIARRIDAGAMVVSLQVPSGEHPWAPFAGTLKGHPLLEEWKQAMAERRRQIDTDPDVP
jgi:predicted RNase H-like HicB family nuclease